MKTRKITVLVLFWALALLSALLTICSSGCGGDDDDTNANDTDACIACLTTEGCTAALGAGWVCQDECCFDLTGDDDDSSGGDDDTGNDDDSGDDDVTSDEWTDSSSGLTWQVTHPSSTSFWEDAIAYCENLSLADHDDWRLPTVSEMRTLIRGCGGTETGGSCGVTDSCLDSTCQGDSCLSCEYGAGPSDGCYGPSELPDKCDWFWTSSPVTDIEYSAWYVDFVFGGVHYDDSDNYYYTRCVR